MVPSIFSLLLISSASGIPRCKEAGKFPIEDQRAYLECSPMKTSKFVPSVRSCGDLKYSALIGACVPQTDDNQNNSPKKTPGKERVKRNADIGSLKSMASVEITAQTVCGTTNLTGIFCVNRTHVGVCIATYSDTGAYSSRTHAYPCSGDTVCLSGKGCQKDDALLSRDRPFSCSDVGLFPDQYNCTIYHNCSTSTTDPKGFFQTTVECTGGQIYSIKLRECTNITEVESCLPGIYCHSDLEVGRLIDDNSIYYVCHTDAAYPGDLSPSFYACPAQQLFNPAVFACVSTISNITWSALPSPIVF
uniref:Putative carbonic anhydrase-like protein 2 n=1 Tax=Lygus hesperus TaxID=30085 RepID=A0A0A9XJV7_LYGHE